MADPLRVVILKPSKYTSDGYVERFHIALRKEVFGFELVPLPRSLQLAAADSLLNHVIKPHLRANLQRATSPSIRQ